MFSLCLTKYETTITQVYHKYFVVGGRHPPAIAEFWPKEPKTWRRPVSLKLNKGASFGDGGGAGSEHWTKVKAPAAASSSAASAAVMGV